MDMTEDNKVDVSGKNDDCKDKMVKKFLVKNLIGAVKYLTPKAKLAFI